MTHPRLPPFEPGDHGITGSRDHSRRDLLRVAAGGLAGIAGWSAVSAARAEETPWLLAPGSAFGAGTMLELARRLAKATYAAPAGGDLPSALKGLTREQYQAIRPAPGKAAWTADGHGFTIEPLLRGSVFSDPVELSLVVDGQVRPLPYDRAAFETDGLALPDLPEHRGHSGFRVRAPFEGGEPTEFALFQGASFFRLLAKGQRFGVTARALTLRPADTRGEEFPRFRAFAIEPPTAEGTLTVHALIDSESAAGALTLVLRPGALSVAEVSGTIVPRKAIDHLGLGGMQAAYLFGPHDRRGTDDARAGAYEATGLQIRNGAGEPIWRPVHNPETLQISSFLDDGPKGFGLVQRARDYRDFEDDVQLWEKRPSLWLEPGDDWSKGAVTLLEIPSDSEFNENVLVYWRPAAPLAADAETPFRYRQSWGWDTPERAPVARVSGTRSGHGSTGSQRLFLVDFTGDDLGPEGIEIALSASPGRIVSRTPYPYPDRRTLRVAFELDPGGERACELRLALSRAGKRLTETWLYRWTP